MLLFNDILSSHFCCMVFFYFKTIDYLMGTEIGLSSPVELSGPHIYKFEVIKF